MQEDDLHIQRAREIFSVGNTASDNFEPSNGTRIRLYIWQSPCDYFIRSNPIFYATRLQTAGTTDARHTIPAAHQGN